MQVTRQNVILRAAETERHPSPLRRNQSRRCQILHRNKLKSGAYQELLEAGTAHHRDKKAIPGDTQKQNHLFAGSKVNE